MEFFRSKILTVILFCLISIGQGYSFGYLYDFYHQNQKLQFGIDSTGSANIGQSSDSLLVCHDKWKVAFSQNPLPQKNHQEMLSFKTDPFLPKLAVLKKLIFVSEFFSEDPEQLLSVCFSPETPPPRA